ncbi:hypothetical protein [Citrobacter tructae]|uniref:Uncharacterized protein n=1 Tax=Citrobacter tructae TaxID=2562449 RepID=A0ABX5T6Y6_9ENTR|nr:hypothetical protein [Citrobacter tructae]QBX81024.1 hypothetical protein E4Z61_11885 [Citrobacter tructae]
MLTRILCQNPPLPKQLLVFYQMSRKTANWYAKNRFPPLHSMQTGTASIHPRAESAQDSSAFTQLFPKLILQGFSSLFRRFAS